MKNNKIYKTIIFIVVMLIPIIYSFFYLKSYWNPYGNLEQMKIAIVNQDKGKDNKNQGKELVKELKEKDILEICDVDLEEANTGLKNEKYYAIIIIPEDFTQCLNSAAENEKQIAKITYKPNQKSNYLASQIINKVVSATELELQSKISKEVVTTLAESLNEVPESLEEISNGSDKIISGTTDLSNGLKDINNGTEKLNDNYITFDEGIKNAYNGSKTLNDGIKQVDSGIYDLNSGSANLNSALEQINNGTSELTKSGLEGITKLKQGIDDINQGSTNLTSGINQYVAGVNTLDQNTQNLLNGIISYGNTHPELLSTDNDFGKIYGTAKVISDSRAIDNLTISGEKIKQGAKVLSQGTNTLQKSTSNLNQLANGMTELHNAIKKIKDGSSNLNNGVQELKNGTEKLQTGSTSLIGGLSTLSSNSDTIQEALETLDNGSKDAYKGSINLLQGEQTFKNEIQNGIKSAQEQIEKLNGLNQYVENPVEIEEIDYGEVKSYGVAFTPLFLSIGLWVGSLMCYVVLYYDQKNRFGILGSDNKNKILQNIIYIGIGAIQGIITAVLLKMGLHLDIQNNLLYYTSSILIGITFMSIIQCLIRNFGDIGKFLALIILVLQLAASGGTFPVETIDKIFQGINPYLPMTYTIKLLKDSLISTDINFVVKNSIILIIITLICLLITLVSEFVKKQIIKKKIENKN